MNQDLQRLEVKVENEGTTPQGRLSATEWNILVAAVKAMDSEGVESASILDVVEGAGYIKAIEVAKTYAPLSAIEGVAKKSYVDETFVKLATAQDIPVRHNFVDGLKVGGISIYRSKDDTIYLDGNLVVRGAFTMYGTDGTTAPSIFDTLPIDNETIKRNANGQLYAVGGGGSGSGGLDLVQLDEYLTTNGYATQSWVTGKGYITSAGSITGNASTASKLQNSVSLWGRSFDGTADLTGSLIVSTGEGYRINYNGYDLRFIVSGDSSNRGIWDNTNNEWMMYRGSSTNIIFPQGNIAIGAHTTPADRLTVVGSISASESFKLTATPTEAFADAQMLFAGGKSRIGVTASGFMGLYANTFTFRPSSTTAASSSAFTIDANANLATTGKLTLPTGSSNFTNASLFFGDKVRIGVNSSNSLGIFSDYAIRLNPDSATTASSTKGLWLLNSGFNGINISSPTQALHVNGKGIFADATNPWISLQRDGVNWYLQVTSSGLKLGKTSANAVGIDESGNLQTPGAITMYYSSDKRLKQNIRKANASKTLMSLGGVFQYEYIDSEVQKNNTYGGSHFGLIYQNVKGTALDKMCHEREDGMGALNYLDTNFISLIAGATMENTTEIEKLKKENRGLKKKVEQLEKRVA